MPLTKEQKIIVRDINEGKNVRVIAVAGSGKTSTIIGTIGDHATTLLLCYNNRLRAETIVRVKEKMKTFIDEAALGLAMSPAPFDVHTFHSFAYTTFDEPLATTDIGIVRVNEMLAGVVYETITPSDKETTASPSSLSSLTPAGRRLLPRREIVARAKKMLPADSLRRLIGPNRYARIIIDEAQDLTPEYFTLSRLLVYITGASLTILGDPRQAIYQFNGASDKYLRNASIYFDRTFVDRKLSVSFRVPELVAKMVNASVLAETSNDRQGDGDSQARQGNTHDRQGDTLAVPITPATTSARPIRPIIYVDHISSRMEIIVDMISKVPANDVMILMYSTRRDGDGRASILLANALTKAGIPVCFNGIGEKDSDGVLMISYHQSKGLERPIVICLDLGEYYFALNPDVRRDILPNLWYVAMTRASKFLVAFIDKPFSFIMRGLAAAGLKSCKGEDVDVDDDKGTRGTHGTHGKDGDTGGDGDSLDVPDVTDEEIATYTSRGFDRLVKYTPTRIYMAIMKRRPFPERMNTMGQAAIVTSPADHSGTLLQEYTRACIIAGKEVNASSFLDTFCKSILGSLKGIALNIGVVTVGNQPIDILTAMSRCYGIANHILTMHEIVETETVRGEYGNVEAIGDVYDAEMISRSETSMKTAETDRVVVIIITGLTIDSRLRVASFGDRRLLIIDILNGAWAKKGW